LLDALEDLEGFGDADDMEGCVMVGGATYYDPK
jgi:hypothetical protein